MPKTHHSSYCFFILLFAALINTCAAASAPELPAQPQSISRNLQHTKDSPPVIIHFQRRAVIPKVSHDSELVTQADQTNQTKQVSAKITPTATELNPTKHTAVIELTRHEKLLINKAKRYFDRNWNATTGLIDSVQGYTHATMWDVASGIGGLLALEALSENSQQLTEFRLEKMLDTLLELPLYKATLPNRQYNTRTAQPSGRMSQTAANGNGWSALDLGRLYIWLEILKRHKPFLANKIHQLKSKWLLERATHKGNLYGTKLTSKKEYFRQEGRLGYLQYAATGYQLAGLNVATAFECDKLETTELDGIKLLIDKGNLPFFTLDPYLLYAIEIGYEESCWNQLLSLYQLHKQNAQTTSKLSAYAEDSLNKAPWFLYNNITYQGKPWQSVSHSGKAVSYPQTFSNKAAFAMSVLFDEAYSQQLAELVISNSARHNVIPTGLYANGKTNTAYNINTNSLILVSLWYKSRAQRAILPSLGQRETKQETTAISAINH
ncbi:DUF3131 domain-containing protein [Shewanella sp. 1CM18E]|uniref:DUF3131 domain-containing protein n=1 Tax=Shewanella sp. 1CM18E TaxID=2929169 RepID=UPI0020C16B7A|nr:DUF3131 domain-containing protein [Shewanella sp. 1CM18E]MCK8046227.1 DUF3131 domain-containing protein [Shewanella sp. 1CM18E]